MTDLAQMLGVVLYLAACCILLLMVVGCLVAEARLRYWRWRAGLRRWRRDGWPEL